MERKKAKLEMTYENYIAVGSSPIAEFKGMRGKPLHEMYDDDQLRKYVAREVAEVKDAHQEALAGGETEKKILEITLRDYLAPNIAYLRKIGRLPKEFEDLDPAAKFALPE